MKDLCIIQDKNNVYIQMRLREAGAKQPTSASSLNDSRGTDHPGRPAVAGCSTGVLGRDRWPNSIHTLQHNFVCPPVSHTTLQFRRSHKLCFFGLRPCHLHLNLSAGMTTTLFLVRHGDRYDLANKELWRARCDRLGMEVGCTLS